MTACAMHDRLLEQRIPPLSADNTAPEAICRIPVRVPKMAPFNTVLVYQLTDDEQHVSYEPVYWNFATPDAEPTRDDECAYEVNTNKDSFAWVSWVERTRELQKQRVWICEDDHLICNELDPEFKRPNVPLHRPAPELQLQFPPTTVYDYVISSELPSSFDFSADVFISSIVISWDPPWLSYEPPTFDIPSWEPPEWTPPEFECDWCGWQPEIPPEWWSQDFDWCASAAPDWYSEIPEWYRSQFKRYYKDNTLKCKYSYFDMAGDLTNTGAECPPGCTLEGTLCHCVTQVNPDICALTNEEKEKLAAQALDEHIYGKQLGDEEEKAFVDQYIQDELSCKWETYTTSDEAAATDENCKFLKECNGVTTYECSRATNADVCNLPDSEKSSLAHKAYLGDDAGWCFNAPTWLDLIPPNPDYLVDPVSPDIDAAVDAACKKIKISGGGGDSCLKKIDSDKYPPYVALDEECIKSKVCAKISASFGIKKWCDHLIHLEFDPSIFKSTECFVVDVTKYGPKHPQRGDTTGTSGITVYAVPSAMFEIDPSLSGALVLEPENTIADCSKMLFKRATGEKGGFLLVEGGNLKVLPFPDKNSILTFSGGVFAWEALNNCDDQCGKKDTGDAK